LVPFSAVNVNLGAGSRNAKIGVMGITPPIGKEPGICATAK